MVELHSSEPLVGVPVEHRPGSEPVLPPAPDPPAQLTFNLGFRARFPAAAAREDLRRVAKPNVEVEIALAGRA
jgi:hypothetical protein